MIKSILIENFQKHKELKIKPDPNVTVLAGASDKGKSSVIRAIKWNALNKPQGDKFIKRPKRGKTAAVEIVTEEGTVRRERSTSRNAYIVNGTELEAFGNNVPEEVSQVLRMDRLNFQYQHDAAYWFSESPGEVSKQLNSIVDLGIIDEALSNLAGRIRKKEAEISVCEERVMLAVQKKNELAHVEEMAKDYAKIEKLQARKEKTEEEIASLRDTIKGIIAHKREVVRLTQAQSAAEKFEKLLRRQIRVSESAQSLENIINDIEHLEAIINTEVPDVSGLTDAITEYEATVEKINSLERLVTEIDTIQEAIWQDEEELKRQERKLKSQIGTKCPLCGTAMKS